MLSHLARETLHAPRLDRILRDYPELGITNGRDLRKYLGELKGGGRIWAAMHDELGRQTGTDSHAINALLGALVRPEATLRANLNRPAEGAQAHRRALLQREDDDAMAATLRPEELETPTADEPAAEPGTLGLSSSPRFDPRSPSGTELSDEDRARYDEGLALLAGSPLVGNILGFLAEASPPPRVQALLAKIDGRDTFSRDEYRELLLAWRPEELVAKTK
jgi:hypothetical protein